MNVLLIGHAAVSNAFRALVDDGGPEFPRSMDRQVIALTSIRTCYSPLKPTEILDAEGAKYFGQTASDNEGGTEADRLFRHITRSGHTSTLEHLTYTFAIEGVSRALLAQLTRHRHLSFSVQSQRYVRFGSADKSGGFGYVTPASVENAVNTGDVFVEGSTAADFYHAFMRDVQEAYDALRAAGVPAEDARMVLPQAATCNLVMTGNLRTLLDFYAKRRPGNGSQAEIAELSERIRAEIVAVDPWLEPYFNVKEAK